MSLFVPSDGILRTNLHWEELQESVFKAFGTEAKFGPNRAAKDVSAGRGALSKICLISPDWQTVIEGVPEKFIVKIFTQIVMIESNAFEDVKFLQSEELAKSLEGVIKKYHNREARLYKLLAEYGVSEIPTPKIYYLQEFTEQNPLNGYIIMEYISESLLYHLSDNLDPQLILQPLRAIAKLEAAGTKFSDEENTLFQSSPYTEALSNISSEQAMQTLFTMMRSLGGEKLENQIKRLEGVIQEILVPERFEKLSDALGMKPVLCHGDLWSTNLMWRKRDGDIELVAVIDFQGAHLGNPSADIVRLLCTCMSGRDRRENWESLLEKFYSYLEEELWNNADMPYNLDMLKESYRRFFPFGAFLVLTMMGIMYRMVMNSDDVENKAKVHEVLIEKTKCLLEDICDFYDDNKLRNETEG